MPFIIILLITNNVFSVDIPGYCNLKINVCTEKECKKNTQIDTQLRIKEELTGSYDRANYQAGGSGWEDEDRDCQDTRAEILINNSLIPPVLSKNGCSVDLGLWYDPYSGKTFESAGDLDIDHIIPLKEADESGANSWSKERKFLFSNSQLNLIPVWNSLNRSKGSKEPLEWLPPNSAYICEYVNRWAFIKWYWQLDVDANECAVLKKLNCISNDSKINQNSIDEINEKRQTIPENAFVIGNIWICNEGYKQVGDKCVEIFVPKNAHVVGNILLCDDGYKMIGEECEKLKVPDNAIVMGNMWLCKEGYKQVGKECEKLKVPDNAFVMGNSWLCKEGYKQVGSKCEKLVVPENAFIMGNSWFCYKGYIKNGNQCEKLIVPKNAFVMGNSWFCNPGYRKTNNECLKE